MADRHSVAAHTLVVLDEELLPPQHRGDVFAGR